MGIQVTHEFSKILATPTTKLLIGLGNSGDKYINTRHNAGFMAVDHFVQQKKLGTFTHKPKLFCDLIESSIESTKVIIAKPTTLMNVSGKAVLALQDYYQLDNSQLLVLHDDIDVEFGKIRSRIGGGTGGHNGLKSIENAIGEDFAHAKIGVKNELREKIEASDFILQHFTKNELMQFEHALEFTNQIIQDFIADNFQETSVSF